MCKSESTESHESRAQSADYSKACSKPFKRVFGNGILMRFNLLAISRKKSKFLTKSVTNYM